MVPHSKMLQLTLRIDALFEIFNQSSTKLRLEDLTVLKRSPDLLNNVKIGQDQIRLIMKHILFYGVCGHFGQVT